jgi:glycerol-3-phosphate O-acyltransferase / dihydroxyacetone phosphate acyltransferase
MGVWAPKRWDLSLAALSQYTTPPIPTPNLWLDKYKTRPPMEEPPVQAPPRRRPPSRRIVRHVLRARAEAARALASFFQHLEQAPEGKRVKASAHLARAYGGWVEEVKTENNHDGNEVVDVYQPPAGWRSAKEVVAFLRNKGAKIANLEHGIEGEWAALSSDADSLTPTGEDSDAAGEDIVFVSSSSSS